MPASFLKSLFASLLQISCAVDVSVLSATATSAGLPDFIFKPPSIA